jgi:ABC-2 type transport system permease protein
MLELARYQARRHLKGAVYLAVGLSLLGTMYVATFPSVSSGIDLDQFIEQMPEIFRELFNISTMNTVEGFLAAELYSIGWILLFGMYIAYGGATLIAEDVERGRMDLLLSLPVSRTRVVVEKFAALLVPVGLANLLVPVVVFAGTALVGYPVDPASLAAVHLLSVPYLLACAAVGLLLSVLVSRASVAQRGALVAVFALFLIESLTIVAGYDWLGAVAPMRYYDPTAILVDGSYDLLGSAVLLAGATLLLAASASYFRYRDV